MRNSCNAVLVVLSFIALAGITGAARAQNMPGNMRGNGDLVMPGPDNDNGARLLMQFAANNDEFDRTLTDLARVVYRRQIPECQAFDQVVRQLPTPYGGLTFPLAKPTNKFPAPLNGLWVEHMKIRGCGKVYQINLLAIARNEGKAPLTLAILPGETLSDPGQQGSVLRMSSQAIRKANATCSDDPAPTYTRMIGYRQVDGGIGNTDARMGWFEEWTFAFCQKKVPVQVAFMPNGNGGYDIKTRVVGADAPADKAADATPATTQQTPSE